MQSELEETLKKMNLMEIKLDDVNEKDRKEADEKKKSADRINTLTA